MSKKKWYEVESGESTWSAMGKLLTAIVLWTIILILKMWLLTWAWNVIFGSPFHYVMTYNAAFWIVILLDVLI